MTLPSPCHAMAIGRITLTPKPNAHPAFRLREVVTNQGVLFSVIRECLTAAFSKLHRPCPGRSAPIDAFRTTETPSVTYSNSSASSSLRAGGRVER
ncbi:MAG: hypothetical protein BWY17_02662 [Deltaproteobacteria bacterium ADurb.Bin207]|jgi:hypothetical protein|nr:MAG: hypothetical protein BWY17_02662 [Deltaproteobacteria bacterium ADurb.Bin207]